MIQVESFTTEGLAPRQRRHFWSEVTSRTFTQLESRPRYPEDFNARLRRVSLGALSFSQAISAPATVMHGASRALHGEHVFLVHLQAHGASVSRQDGRDAVLGEGDFTLCDSSRPYAVTFDSPNDMLVLRIPALLLRERLAQPELLTAQRISGASGVGGLVSRTLRLFWSECTSGLESAAAEQLGSNFLDLLVTALSTQPRQLLASSTVVNAQRLRIRYFIEDHLLQPDLDANTIAAALRITPRYVHRLFEAEGESLGQHVQRRRLDESARRLRAPAHAARSIAAIAFACGFVDATHFARCFRKRFGTTPGEYRKHNA